ncbi:cytochrome b/b6 domain-containing protein [Glaciibacter sp. 2TAF33]|uniref:cytochrome b/b6 domain-containing protein n=1 Tax=Glaciibacter sp. 2TAF33 TaxID=3233015 RepID=UPI003F8E17FA
MATYTQALRRGLPRRPGGEPWPPAGDAPAPGVDSLATDAVAFASVPVGTTPEVVPVVVADPPPASSPVVAAGVAAPAAQPVATSIRRGLPRVAGGDRWPAASVAGTSSQYPVATTASVMAAKVAPAEVLVAPAVPADPTVAPAAPAAAAVAGAGATLRRGLPRVAGGDPWPPVGFVPAGSAGQAPAPAPATEAVATPVVREPVVAAPVVVEVPAARPVVVETLPPAAAATTAPHTPAPHTPAPHTPAQPTPATGEKGLGRFTRRQWMVGVALGSGWLIVLAALLVLGVRWFLDLDIMQDFLTTYPGEYQLPGGAPVGFPAWLGWQHFFNVFLMVLIIRSGLQVRSEKRPNAFWTPKNGSRGKISLTLWFHQSLDILWLVNGLAFVVLLFVTGQWMRIVPTSWDVFPNALSAALQYLSLDWPVENGWVNYNALQQLAYFTTVFIAAPLAAITGVRMSGLWPSRAKALTRAYPVEWARAVHFPVMLYFVLFIFVHVVLVISTGALRNLNHMYGGQDAGNWVGFWIFAGSLIVIAAGWAAARPLVLAPIAGLMGKVSAR